MTALKDVRAELGALLASKLNVVSAPLGANVNPPCVVVQPATPYLEPRTYRDDKVTYDVIVVAGPGDPPAQMDSLDDLLDEVRDAVRVLSPSKSLKFSYEYVEPAALTQIGDNSHLTATVRITHERFCDGNSTP